MKLDRKIENLLKSISLLEKKRKEVKYLAINKNVNPLIARQIKSIIDQSVSIDNDKNK